jgi:ornithine--oxo-acid transaminase
MVAIELVPEAGGVRRYCDALKTRGLLAKDTHVDMIHIAPPLVINRDQVD